MRVALVVAVVVSAATAAPAAQPPAPATVLSDLLHDWSNMKDTIADLADAMPEDKYAFRPTSDVRTFGEQLLHIAFGNVMSLRVLGAKATPPAIDMKATSKPAIMKAVAESFEYASAVLREQTEQSIAESIQGPPVPELGDRNHRPYGAVTRAKLMWAALGHAWDEYGAMTVYLRLNNIVPPASRK